MRRNMTTKDIEAQTSNMKELKSMASAGENRQKLDRGLYTVDTINKVSAQIHLSILHTVFMLIECMIQLPQENSNCLYSIRTEATVCNYCL